MFKRICFIHVEIEEPRSEVVVAAWPWSNNPSDLTPQLADDISLAVGGLPVVLLASSAEGIHSYGRREHATAVATIDFSAVKWRILDLEDRSQPVGRNAA